MRILGLIPARGGSKGVPGKNKKLLNGVPLINYTIEVALQCQQLNALIVSTDDAEIKKIAEDAGASVPFVRPAALASDSATSLSVVQHALRHEQERGVDYDAVCLLQPTTPFRTLEFLNSAIDKFMAADVDSLFSVLPVAPEFNPHWVFLTDEKNQLYIATGEKEIISRRQDLPPAYIRDGSIYLTKTSVVLNANSLYGTSMAYIQSDGAKHVNIDTANDWAEAEKIAKSL